MKKYIKKHALALLGVFVGAGAGYAYWWFVGCSSGQCAITSNPINSSLYGALMGGLSFSLFRKNKNETV